MLEAVLEQFWGTVLGHHLSSSCESLEHSAGAVLGTVLEAVLGGGSTGGSTGTALRQYWESAGGVMGGSTGGQHWASTGTVLKSTSP